MDHTGTYEATSRAPLLAILSGLTRTGKSTSGKYLHSGFFSGESALIRTRGMGFDLIIPQEVKEEYAKDGLPVPRHEYTMAAKKFFAEKQRQGEKSPYGDLVIETLLRPYFSQSKRDPVVIIDSIRGVDDIMQVQKFHPNNIVIVHTANYNTLVRRMISGNDPIDGNISEAEARRNIDLEEMVHKPHLALGYAASMPNGYVIDTSNQDNDALLLTQLETIAKKIRVGK